jgi:hypothetical protein
LGFNKLMDEIRLRRLFHFNEADLAANRRGHFSEKQIVRLDAEAKQERKSAWGSAAILFLIAAAGMAIGIVIGSISPTQIGRIAMFLCMGAVWPLAWAGKAVQIILAANRLNQPTLSFVRGTVEVMSHADMEHVLRIDGIEFDVDGNPTGAFGDGEEYTIYYVASTQEILSIDS